jgi:death-on-curing protein
VGTRRKEPRWLTRLVLDAIHTDQMREHGGLRGVRDENLLESALASARQRWHYDTRADLADLAATYAFSLVSSHPYRDGNKRIGFLAAVTFLGINGLDFEAAEEEVVTQIVMLAQGRLSQDQLATWIRARATPER